jgi:hypothetical protein
MQVLPSCHSTVARHPGDGRRYNAHMNFVTRAFFSAFLFFGLPFFASANVVITEVMYDLPGGDSKHEWVEVKNEGGALNLSEWKLYEGESNHKLTPHTGDGTVPSGGYAILADNPVTFLADYPGFSGIVFDVALSGGLNNTNGESLTLRDAELTDRDSVTYSPSWGASGDGNSLHKVGSAWEALLPTPGAGPGTERAAVPPPPPPEPEKPKTITPEPTPQSKTEAPVPILNAQSSPATEPAQSPAPPAQQTVVQIAEVPQSESAEPNQREENAVAVSEFESADLASSPALADAAQSENKNMNWLWSAAAGLLAGLSIGGIFLFRKKPNSNA